MDDARKFPSNAMLIERVAILPIMLESHAQVSQKFSKTSYSIWCYQSEYEQAFNHTAVDKHNFAMTEATRQTEQNNIK